MIRVASGGAPYSTNNRNTEPEFTFFRLPEKKDMYTDNKGNSTIMDVIIESDIGEFNHENAACDEKAYKTNSGLYRQFCIKRSPSKCEVKRMNQKQLKNPRACEYQLDQAISVMKGNFGSHSDNIPWITHSECDNATNQRHGLKIHKEHSKKKNHKCSTCDFATNRKQYLKAHINYVHLNLKQYRCDICYYVTNQNGELKNHIDSVHLKTTKFGCCFCDYETNFERNLKPHVDTVHSTSEEYECYLCHFATNLKENLDRHIDSIHLNSKKHKCNLCDFATNRKSSLQKHNKNVHIDNKQHK